MEILPSIIKGSSHIDERGRIAFYNEFDMAEVKRFYSIAHPNTEVIRGWRGHRIEQRWFSVVRGAFKISLAKIDDWQNPNPNAALISFELYADENVILHVPPGYATCLKALVADSEVLVFGDKEIGHASNDDYLYPKDYFKYN